MLRRSLFGTGIALMTQAFLAGEPAFASADPAAFVSDFGRQLHIAAGNSSADLRRSAFRLLLDEDVDVPALGRFVVGRFWRVLSPAEQQQFLCLFENYVVVAFADQRLSQYAAAGSLPRVTGSRAVPGGVVVSSQITRGNAPPVEVDWRLSEHDGNYKITDIVIAGLSLAANGRSELEGVIARNGGQPQSILAVLRQRMADAVTPAVSGRCSMVPAGHPDAAKSAETDGQPRLAARDQDNFWRLPLGSNAVFVFAGQGR